MKVLIVLNGTIEDYEFINNFVKKFSPKFIICADGGTRHARALNILPNMILGDLDSVRIEDLNYYKEKGVIVQTYPREKDKTDGEIAVIEALNLAPKEVMVIGAAGGRIDHTISNIHMLDVFSKQKINAYILDEKNKIFVISEDTKIEGKKGDIVSIFPFGGSVTGITLKGFKYPLNDAKMDYGLHNGTANGISNEIEEEECEIKFNTGKLLVIYNF